MGWSVPPSYLLSEILPVHAEGRPDARRQVRHDHAETFLAQHVDCVNAMGWHIQMNMNADPIVAAGDLWNRIPKDIRAEVQKCLNKANAAMGTDLPLSLPCKRILAYAAEEAERLHHSLIDVDQLLVGIVREEDGLACEILSFYQFNVRRQITPFGSHSMLVTRS
jgi:ATP-dependent Clp protease ATP-binding subunit ClpA